MDVANIYMFILGRTLCIAVPDCFAALVAVCGAVVVVVVELNR